MTKTATTWGRPLALDNICDICKKPRSSGDNRLKHVKCSKIRQARYQALREQSK
ncbi:hypothetical protein AH02_46 [Pseudomonas phage AH02]|nr:hypothetical protein AH02_46 [Pseudomonas phage AH02]